MPKSRHLETAPASASLAAGALVAFWIACLVAFGGCVSLLVTGADTVEDLAAEAQYKAVYAEHMGTLAEDNRPYAPKGTDPGVCNKGGTKQGCYDTDTAVIRDTKGMLDALAATAVPPRYVAADTLLRDAFAEEMRGLELRRRVIAEGDDALRTEHKVVLAKAIDLIQAAYDAFPADNRPQPRP